LVLEGARQDRKTGQIASQSNLCVRGERFIDLKARSLVTLSQTLPVQRPLKGVLLILLAVLVFACMDTAGKYLMTKFGVSTVAFARYAINVIFLILIFAPRQGAKIWHSNRTLLIVLRGFALALATFFMGMALQRMPLGETVAIIYMQGFGVMFAAAYFLRERIHWIGWVCTVASFAGVLLIARPGGDLAPAGVLFALICAAVSVLYVLLSRSLASSETTLSMLFHVGIVGTAFFMVQLPFNWRPAPFEPLDLVLMLFLGAGSLGGHFLHTTAYRFAPASLLAPFNYFHIALATLLGWIVYHHVPDFFAMMGMSLIAISGAAVALHTHITKTAPK
jgi:drug/metabolite transporter (DMT)-like permease